MTESENENDQNDLDHFDHILSKPLFLLNRLRGKPFNRFQGLRCKGTCSVQPFKKTIICLKDEKKSKNGRFSTIIL